MAGCLIRSKTVRHRQGLGGIPPCFKSCSSRLLEVQDRRHRLQSNCGLHVIDVFVVHKTQRLECEGSSDTVRQVPYVSSMGLVWYGMVFV